MLINLTNGFHGSTATLRVDQHTALSALPGVRGSASWAISRRQFARAHKALCGMADCQCGGIYRATPPVQTALGRDGRDRHWIYVSDLEDPTRGSRGQEERGGTR